MQFKEIVCKDGVWVYKQTGLRVDWSELPDTINFKFGNKLRMATRSIHNWIVDWDVLVTDGLFNCKLSLYEIQKTRKMRIYVGVPE
jgi:hypothetical protein